MNLVIPEENLKEYEAVKASVTEKVQDLASFQRRLDESGIAIQTLIDFMFPPERKWEFELAFLRNYEAALTSALSQVRQAALTEGVSGANSGLIIAR